MKKKLSKRFSKNENEPECSKSSEDTENSKNTKNTEQFCKY